MEKHLIKNTLYIVQDIILYNFAICHTLHGKVKIATQQCQANCNGSDCELTARGGYQGLCPSLIAWSESVHYTIL